jgi:Pentapeptide repeats (9 copies)/Pentapeptide repeats (8 copies)
VDEAMYQKIQQYVQALKALQRSVERAVQEGTYEGTGKMAVKGYQGIQRKVAEILPEDFYVTDTLALEVNGEVQERHLLSQVQLAASQMIIYLDGVLREYRAASGVAPADWGDLRTWGRDFGRDLQQQIINMTRATIERAVRNVDIDVQGPDSMRGADMEGAHLEGANFSGRNLRDVNLKGADLRHANFSGANLGGANLEDTNAEGTNFSGANLKDASLGDANFTNANLTGANFKGASLKNANLTGATISGANFKDAELKGATMPQGQEYRNEGDLFQYGASARHSSTGRAHVRIEIDDDAEEKRKDDEEKPKNDDDLV